MFSIKIHYVQFPTQLEAITRGDSRENHPVKCKLMKLFRFRRSNNSSINIEPTVISEFEEQLS